MKKLSSLLLVSMLGGALTLGSYKLFLEDQAPTTLPEPHQTILPTTSSTPGTSSSSTKLVTNSMNSAANAGLDFTEAANKTVHAVVHIKNVSISREPRTISEYMHGMRGGRAIRGSGSGVIITPDGYIVTNNHVIAGANELEVTLNNNITYKAKVIGSDPQGDIALIKIDAKDLDYIPFGDSDNVKTGEWALAVGNPFNLTSTVTAGIISAKGRDLNEGSAQMQSFIQTDAAINPGNSGGALVNTKGELIGINTAITSQTGSYIGYGFAVPSNNARKIVEDILEYGDVQQAILGISASTLNPQVAKSNELPISQGVLVNSVTDGAEKAGLQNGDLITKIDGIKIRKLSDLNSYIRTKRPKDHVEIGFFRNGKNQMATAKLTKYESYALQAAGVEITNAKKEYLKDFHAEHGVRIASSLSRELQIPTDQFIIIGIDNQYVDSVNDVRLIMENKTVGDNFKITFKNRKGYEESYVFQK